MAPKMRLAKAENVQKKTQNPVAFEIL